MEVVALPSANAFVGKKRDVRFQNRSFRFLAEWFKALVSKTSFHVFESHRTCQCDWSAKNFEIMIFIIIFTIIYAISLFGVGTMYANSTIDITFWALCILFLPGINTIVLVKLLISKYGIQKIGQFFSFKKFLSDIDKI